MHYKTHAPAGVLFDILNVWVIPNSTLYTGNRPRLERVANREITIAPRFDLPLTQEKLSDVSLFLLILNRIGALALV